MPLFAQNHHKAYSQGWYYWTRHPSHKRYFNRIQNSIKIYSALVWNIQNQSQKNFAHITTVGLSWLVQDVIVICQICYEQEHYKVSLNFKFNRNIICGTATSNRNLWSLLWCPPKLSMEQTVHQLVKWDEWSLIQYFSHDMYDTRTIQLLNQYIIWFHAQCINSGWPSSASVRMLVKFQRDLKPLH